MEPQRTELPFEDRPSAATGLTPREALEGAKAALAAQGLTLDAFGETMLERIALGEISKNDALATLIEHYRVKP